MLWNVRYGCSDVDGDADDRSFEDVVAQHHGDDDIDVHDDVDDVLLVMILMIMVMMLMMEYAVDCEIWMLTVIVTMASTKSSVS